MRFLKPGKVVLVLNGRYAGKKAVIVKNFDDGSDPRHYGHCLVAGIRKYPQHIAKRMSKRMIARRSTIKPFVKVLNFTHIMPTRSGTLECAHSLQLFSYSAEMTNLKDVAITPEGIKDLKARREIRKQVKKVFEAKYKAGEHRWFFEKLRF